MITVAFYFLVLLFSAACVWVADRFFSHEG